MKRLFTLLFTGVIALSVNANAVNSENKPNVIIIYADDLGYGDVGFHQKTAPDVVTPNLDRLAKNSVVFTNAYAPSPVCSNSRLGLSTGRYVQRWGAYYYNEGGMPNDEQTIAEMMRDQGYRTYKVGKTHMNNGPKADAMKHGFDHFLGFQQHSWDFNLLSEKDVAAYEKKSKGSVKRANHIGIGPLRRDHNTSASFENTTTTEVFAQESINVIKQKSDKPFYLQLEFNAVHTPLYKAPNKKYADKYGIPERAFNREDKVWPFPHWDPIQEPNFKTWYSKIGHLKWVDPYGRKNYLAHLEHLDEVIGNILTTLEQQGLTDNTFIFFSSDNGGSHQSYANNMPLSGYKYSLTEGGIKVPMLISWPNKIQKGQQIAAPVTHRDIFATLADILNSKTNKALDAQSLMPVMTSTATKVHHKPLFWDSGKRDSWVVRDGDWKLIYIKSGRAYDAYQLDENGIVKPKLAKVKIAKGLQLFNLTKDPGELNNLAKQYPERVKKMQQAYKAWRAQMIDPKRTPKNPKIKLVSSH